MTLVTWIAIGVCGPGALFVLGWFVVDLLRLRRRHRALHDPDQREGR